MKWSPKEDAKLIKAFKIYQKQWKSIHENHLTSRKPGSIAARAKVLGLIDENGNINPEGSNKKRKM